MFGNILKNNPHQHPLIYLRDVKKKELVNILDFMYQGEVNIENDNLKDFLLVADDLKVRGLSDEDRTNSTNVSRSDPDFFTILETEFINIGDDQMLTYFDKSNELLN